MVVNLLSSMVGNCWRRNILSRLTRDVLLLLLCSSLPVSSGDFFDDDDMKDFDEMSKNDQPPHQGLSQNWEERCLEVGGQSVLDRYGEEQEKLLYCVIQQFDFVEIQEEIEEKKKVGDLDEVFKKYCRQHVSTVRSCLTSFLDVSRLCLRPQERPGLNVTLGMVDSAIEFVCHNSGDRIALFMSYDGVQCVVDHKDEIMSCINRSVPEVLNAKQNMRSKKMHFYVFQQENCRKGDAIIECVEASLMKCSDPTPSNLVNGLMQAMREDTPCATAAEGWHSGAPGSNQSPLLVVFIALSLTLSAANAHLRL